MLAPAQEAALQVDEAREHARSIGRWRRWRLEGTAAGNSRFVGRATAERLQRRYGGKVVHYQPPRREPKVEAAARELGECPRCKASPGQPCRSFSGRRMPHAGRPRA